MNQAPNSTVAPRAHPEIAPEKLATRAMNTGARGRFGINYFSTTKPVIPAKAGIQGLLDSRLRGNDGVVVYRADRRCRSLA